MLNNFPFMLFDLVVMLLYSISKQTNTKTIQFSYAYISIDIFFTIVPVNQNNNNGYNRKPSTLKLTMNATQREKKAKPIQ